MANKTAKLGILLFAAWLLSGSAQIPKNPDIT